VAATYPSARARAARAALGFRQRARELQDAYAGYRGADRAAESIFEVAASRQAVGQG